jgi:hypothetical protein
VPQANGSPRTGTSSIAGFSRVSVTAAARPKRPKVSSCTGKSRAGIHQLKRIDEILAAASGELPDLVREECLDLMEQIGEKTNVRDR